MSSDSNSNSFDDSSGEEFEEIIKESNKSIK